MKSNQALKNLALDSLEGKWGRSIVASMIVLVVVGGLYAALFMANQYVAHSSLLFMFPLLWGAVIYFLRLVRGESLGFGRLFDGYSVQNLFRVMFTLWLQNFIIALSSLLLIVPGIMVGCAYAMTPFILKDRPDLQYYAVLKESTRMMKGHKMEYLLLQLSFLGWAILSILTAGIGLLWFIPYAQTTTAHFYEQLKAEQPAAEPSAL
jgi:uncharacterized membrane protein